MGILAVWMTAAHRVQMKGTDPLEQELCAAMFGIERGYSGKTASAFN